MKNTNTAFGAAFAKAFGSSAVPADRTEDKDNKNTNNTGSLARKIKDKKSVAAELGIGEITLEDILKELENLQETHVMKCRFQSLGQMYLK